MTTQKMFDLTGSIAAIPGGTGTLGGAIARGLAQHGAKVAVIGRNEERGNTCVKQIEDAGGIAAFVQADGTSKDALGAARASIEQQFGTVDILVNCTGGNDARVTVVGDKKVEDVELDDWKQNLALNIEAGCLLPSQVFGPAMVEAKHGSIINIASVSAHIPLSRVVAYSAAKAAVMSLTQFFAREWATTGVRVNSITPGFFLADQNRALLINDDGSPTGRAKSILTHTPMDRFGEADELIGAAVFLASHAASSFVTGTDVCVDGGFLATTI